MEKKGERVSWLYSEAQIVDELRIDIFTWDRLHWMDQMFLRHYLSMKHYYNIQAMDRVKSDAEAKQREFERMKNMPRQFVPKRGKVG